jgi:site-specific DNA recombinase
MMTAVCPAARSTALPSNDIQTGKIDIVVVYKVDRLSRSLLDFHKLIELFERHQTTFVSITQSFNTTDAMGRMHLNIMLTFAQYG